MIRSPKSASLPESLRGLAVGVAILAVVSGPSQAATLFWSGNGASQGGAGTWNTTDARFGTSSAGPFTTVWNNTTNAADSVTFGGATSNATLGAAITVRQLTFNNASTVSAGGFSLTTGGTVNLTFAAGGSGRGTGGTVTAPIVGTNGVTISGTAGPIVFTGSSTYTGQTAINAALSGVSSRLNLGAGGSIGGSSGVSIGAGSIFAVNRSDVVTQGTHFPAIGGAGQFIKLGTGTTILAAVNTYTGATTVSAGALTITGTLAATATTVSAAAMLGGSGTTAGDVTFSSGSKFRFDAAAPLSVGGRVTFSDPASFGVDDIVGLDSSVAEGTYTLISGSVNTAGLANLGSSNAYDLGSGKSAYFQQGSLQVVVIPEPASLSATAAAGLAIAMVMRRRRTYPVG